MSFEVIILALRRFSIITGKVSGATLLAYQRSSCYWHFDQSNAGNVRFFIRIEFPISHTDHKEPDNNGSTMTFLLSNMFAHVSSVRRCGETKTKSIDFFASFCLAILH